MKNFNYSLLSGKCLLLVAMCLVLLTHGIILYFTLPKTYDAFVHIFFADHYNRFWFEPFEYRWYTGFNTTSYPPLVHQAIALLGKVFPMKIAFVIYAILIFELLVIGVYRFSKLFASKRVAGIASILAVLSPALIETLHVYGQLPTLTGLAFLLNGLPFLYFYLRENKAFYLILFLGFLSLVVSSHHVTVIFGMVFFIAPLIFMALHDKSPNKPADFQRFIGMMLLQIKQSWKQLFLTLSLIISLVVGLIFPYWVWSKNNPITQVSIPHGSRDNFLENFSSGLIFYIIPLALVFCVFLAIVFLITSHRRYIGWAVSFFLCLLLGSGGTTPLPKLMLGENAFNILTLDRFGFWAAIIALPFMATFIYSLLFGKVSQYWRKKWGKALHFTLLGITGFTYFLFLIFVFHLGSFRPLQPKEVEIEPITNFINRDHHYNWRYLTLGFGDQMAWLSANTLAATVDGNYHSARKLPELTSRPVERIENAKFSGKYGIASLSDFLSQAEKYHLKYVFSNDKYYDPLLYFMGWNRTIQLENGIMVWEKDNITSVPSMKLPYMNPILKYMWGIIPMSMALIVLLLTFYYLYRSKFKVPQPEYLLKDSFSKTSMGVSSVLPLIFFSLFLIYEAHNAFLFNEQKSPETSVENYYNHLDFQEFEKAFSFIKPEPNYDFEKYLLEKSVTDGGMFPNYAQLDSVKVTPLFENKNQAEVLVQGFYNTAMGHIYKMETLSLEKQKNRWYILPKPIDYHISDEQVLQYDFRIFKKVGKRKISSFPTEIDDRIKKPFVQVSEMNWVQDESENYLVGEIMNADNVPVNFLLKLSIFLEDDVERHYYPKLNCKYNLSPKEITYFKIPFSLTDSENVHHIEVNVSTNISERGYIQSGDIEYTEVRPGNFDIQMTNTMPFDLTVPGVMGLERNSNGDLINVNLQVYEKALKSGQNREWNYPFPNSHAKLVNKSIQLIINGNKSRVKPLGDTQNNTKNRYSFVPHSFISEAIYVH